MFTSVLGILLISAGQADNPARVLADAPPGYTGVAYAQSDGNRLFTEEHQERLTNGKISGIRTVFRDLARKPMAERELDFLRFAYKPDMGT
jgi:hypothetical protein